MEIAYAAHTESCTFMLDDDGICRWVAAASKGPGPYAAMVKVPDHAERCIGAQYVASMDLSVKGGLIDLPTPGAPLLFARIEPNGRIALVRTGPLVRFETRSSSSGVRAMPAIDALPPLPPAEAHKPKLEPYRFDTIPEINGDDEQTTPYRPSQAPAAGRASSIPPRATTSDVVPRASRVPSAPPAAVEAPRKTRRVLPDLQSSSPYGTIRPPAPSDVPSVRPSIRPPAPSQADTVKRPRPSIVRIVPPVWDGAARLPAPTQHPAPNQHRRAR